MRHHILVLCVSMALPFRSEGQLEREECARKIISESVHEMGGEKLLKSISSVSFKGEGYQNIIEQSERYEGPYIPAFRTFDYTFDFKNCKALFSNSGTFPNSPSFSMVTALDHGSIAIKRGNSYYPHYFKRPMAQDEFDFSPLTILLSAANAEHVECADDTTMELVRHKVIQFEKDRVPVRLFINAGTKFITGIEIMRSYDENFFHIWGDSRKLTIYSFWELFGNGIHFPLQHDVFVNGKKYQTSLIESLSFNSCSLDSVLIPSSVALESNNSANYRNQFREMANKVREIAQNIWLISGPCNTTIIDNGSELTVLEAPYSSQFSADVLNKVRSHWPEKKIREVITTSDAWLHIGGLREYVANNIPVIALSENATIIEDLLTAPYLSLPDLYQKRKSAAVLTKISGRYSIPGDNELIIIPFRTESAERMLMVYMPKFKILYASDLYQPKLPNGKYFVLHYNYEVYRAVERERIDVDFVYGMHTDLVPFSELTESLSIKK